METRPKGVNDSCHVIFSDFSILIDICSIQFVITLKNG